MALEPGGRRRRDAEQLTSRGQCHIEQPRSLSHIDDAELEGIDPNQGIEGAGVDLAVDALIVLAITVLIDKIAALRATGMNFWIGVRFIFLNFTVFTFGFATVSQTAGNSRSTIVAG